jgi:hypothetical protein
MQVSYNDEESEKNDGFHLAQHHGFIMEIWEFVGKYLAFCFLPNKPISAEVPSRCKYTPQDNTYFAK